MRTKLTSLIVILFCLFSHTSCGQQDGNASSKKSTSPVAKPKAGFITGIATTASGKPLAGATIAISGFSGDGQQVNRYVDTKADGTYEVKLPTGGMYRVNNGHARITIDGVAYSHRLHPLEKNIEDLKSVDKGLVSSFVLQLKGMRPQEKKQFLDPKRPNSYYGQHILVELRGDNAQNSTPDAEITTTLTPKGLLADGTKGTPLSFKRTIKNIYTATGQGYELNQTEVLPDIPLGIYTAAATVTKPGGQPETLLLSNRSSGEQVETMEVKFKPGASTGIEGFILTLHFPS